MKKILLLSTALSIIIKVRGDLVYLCNEGWGNDERVIGEEEYKQCGVNCTECRAFEAICIFETQATNGQPKEHSVKKVTYEVAQTCINCICNTIGEERWKQEA